MLDIFNDAIVSSTALYDYKARAPESMVGWFRTKETGSYPVIGAIGDSGELPALRATAPFEHGPHTSIRSSILFTSRKHTAARASV
jgi:L-amino acid N-acyltransferase